MLRPVLGGGDLDAHNALVHHNDSVGRSSDGGTEFDRECRDYAAQAPVARSAFTCLSRPVLTDQR